MNAPFGRAKALRFLQSLRNRKTLALQAKKSRRDAIVLCGRVPVSGPAATFGAWRLHRDCLIELQSAGRRHR